MHVGWRPTCIFCIGCFPCVLIACSAKWKGSVGEPCAAKKLPPLELTVCTWLSTGAYQSTFCLPPKSPEVPRGFWKLWKIRQKVKLCSRCPQQRRTSKLQSPDHTLVLLGTLVVGPLHAEAWSILTTRPRHHRNVFRVHILRV